MAYFADGTWLVVGERREREQGWEGVRVGEKTKVMA
jgi:hypothetical protein